MVARSGADLLLLVFAVFAYLQLRNHGAATGAVVDPVLVVGPVLCLLAGAAIVLRLLPMLARRADARAGSARSLALPFAAWGVARRPQGAAAAFLVVLATACATFGVGFSATWAQSEREQASAGVGTDLSVPAPAMLGHRHRTSCGHRWTSQPGHQQDHDSGLAHPGRRQGAAGRGGHAERRRPAARRSTRRQLGRGHRRTRPDRAGRGRPAGRPEGRPALGHVATARSRTASRSSPASVSSCRTPTALAPPCPRES